MLKCSYTRQQTPEERHVGSAKRPRASRWLKFLDPLPHPPTFPLFKIPRHPKGGVNENDGKPFPGTNQVVLSVRKLGEPLVLELSGSLQRY